MCEYFVTSKYNLNIFDVIIFYFLCEWVISFHFEVLVVLVSSARVALWLRWDGVAFLLLIFYEVAYSKSFYLLGHYRRVSIWRHEKIDKAVDDVVVGISVSGVGNIYHLGFYKRYLPLTSSLDVYSTHCQTCQHHDITIIPGRIWKYILESSYTKTKTKQAGILKIQP